MNHRSLRSTIAVMLILALAVSFMAISVSAEGWCGGELEVNKGETFSIDLACICDDDDGWSISNSSSITWLYNDPDCGTATFYAKESGTATISFYCSTCDCSGKYTITIQDNSKVSPGLYLSDYNIILSEGDTDFIFAGQANYVDTKLVWSSSNSGVVYVSASDDCATLYAISAGQAKISVTDTISGESKSAYVNVSGGEYDISVSSLSSAVYNVGDYSSALTVYPTVYNEYGEKVSGVTLSYQWYYGASAYTCTTPISGATGSSYYPSTSYAGTTYYACSVSYNTTGYGVQAITSPVAVTVLDTDYVVYVEPTYSSLSYGDSTTVTASVYTFDGRGNAVPYSGAKVNFSTDDSHSSLSKTSATTNSKGVATVTLYYDSASSSKRTATVTATLSGTRVYDDYPITLKAYTADPYKIELKSDASSLSYGDSASIYAYVYKDGSLLTSASPKITWSLNNGNNFASLSSTSTTASRGSASNTIYASMALASARSVTVTASVKLDGKTYTASKDFTIKATVGSIDITSVGTSFASRIASSIASAVPTNVAYICFTLPSASVGTLYYDRETALVGGTAVRSTDKLYFTGSANLLLRNIYFLPAADCSGTVSLSYTTYTSSGSRVGSGTLSLNVAKQKTSAYFYDVKAAWCADAIDFMATSGMVTGTSATTFSPSATLTRGQLLTILYRANGSPSVTGMSNPFNDVSSSAYYHDAVLWAYYNGYADPNSSSKFGATANITREEICAILWRIAGSPSSSYNLNGYSDVYNVSSYALTAMRWMVEKNYLRGSGTMLNPKGSATRAEVAVILHRYCTE